MRIVQVVTQMEAAGVQRVAYLLHRALLKCGHDSELWFLYFKRTAYAGAGIHVLWDHKPSALENISLVRTLFARVRAHRPHVIIAHTYYANILAHLAGLLAGTGTRLAVQHNPVQTFPFVAGHLDRLFASLGIYTAQVAVSDAVLDSMAAYPVRIKDRIHRVYNGIEFGQDQVPSWSPHLNHVPASVPKILNVGRLSVQKNHQAMLETMARLPNAHLVLVGEGEIRAKIESQVKGMKLTDRVTFVGEVPPEDVRAIMNCCDLFLFPSLWEAMPMSLLEAMAAGMPIVASNIPANCEALQDTGVLVPPEPTQLVAAITELLNNPAAAAELGRKAAVRAHHFTVDSMVDGYERLFTAGSSKAPSRVDRHAPVQASLSRALRSVETAGESNRRQQ